MNYEDYTVEDFILDEDFRNWVLFPDQANRMFWLKWIETHPQKMRLVEEARNIILSAEYDEINVHEEEIIRSWEKLKNKIAANEAALFPSGQSSQGGSLKFPRSALYKVAAVFVGFLLLTTGYYFYSRSSDTIHSTQFGEVKTFWLPDSSKVILNANSTVTVHRSLFATNSREVSLQGEAYFVVKKNHQGIRKKFVVHANDVAVEVLGTTFNVNNRRERTWVVLKSGKVQLKDNESLVPALTMSPGELAEFSRKAGEFTVKKVDAERYTSWTNNQLIFDGNTLDEIAILLEENYGFEVTIRDTSLLKRKFKGKFPADRPDILLSALSESFNLKMTKAENRITIDLKK